MLQGLSANMHYRIQLRAHNRIGFSLPAEVYLKTSRGEQYNLYNLSNGALRSSQNVACLVVSLFFMLNSYTH